MKSLKEYFDKRQKGVPHIVAEQCTVIIASQENEEHMPVSPALKPTRALSPGDIVELCENSVLTPGIRTKIGNEYAWIEIDELEKISVKEYRDMSDNEIKRALRRISRPSQSEDEMRQRIIDELGYPYSKEGIRILKQSNIDCTISVCSPRGKEITY